MDKSIVKKILYCGFPLLVSAHNNTAELSDNDQNLLVGVGFMIAMAAIISCCNMAYRRQKIPDKYDDKPSEVTTKTNNEERKNINSAAIEYYDTYSMTRTSSSSTSSSIMSDLEIEFADTTKPPLS